MPTFSRQSNKLLVKAANAAEVVIVDNRSRVVIGHNVRITILVEVGHKCLRGPCSVAVVVEVDLTDYFRCRIKGTPAVAILQPSKLEDTRRCTPSGHREIKVTVTVEISRRHQVTVIIREPIRSSV